jgi:hypothetical protein
VNTFFSAISGISEKICRIAKIGSSLVVNDAYRVLFSDNQRERSHLMLDFSDKVDKALFGLLRIQSFLKKVAECELVLVKMQENRISFNVCLQLEEQIFCWISG